MGADILLDVNVTVDILLKREPHYKASLRLLNEALSRNKRIWLYAGSVQTLHYVCAQELGRLLSIPFKEGIAQSRALLNTFSASVQWLPALSEDGEVWQAEEPEDEQLKRAFRRLGEGALFVSRDLGILETTAGALSPEEAVEALKTEETKLPFVDLSVQRDHMRPQLQNSLFRVIHSNKFINGPDVGKLAEELAAYSGVGHAFPCSSGTDALLLAMMALGVKPGDEVLVPAFTFIATGSMVAHLGAVPVFVDVDPGTFNIDPSALEEKIGKKSVGIIPVSLYGQCADMDSINKIAAEHGLWVIEDAAQSFGGSYKGRKSGSLSKVSTTSFFPAKPLGCYGDGGAVLTDDEALAEKVRLYANHGQQRRYHHSHIGINGRMDSLQAAVVRAKLPYLDEEIEKRNRVAAAYTERLEKLVGTPRVLPHNISTWAQYTIRVENRDELRDALSAKGIPTAIHYPMPLPRQEAFAYLKQAENFPVSDRLSETVMSLPMHAYLSESEIDRVCKAIEESMHNG